MESMNRVGPEKEAFVRTPEKWHAGSADPVVARFALSFGVSLQIPKQFTVRGYKTVHSFTGARAQIDLCVGIREVDDAQRPATALPISDGVERFAHHNLSILLEALDNQPNR
jgi:hypothetical protein